jgi:hypothetical protein
MNEDGPNGSPYETLAMHDQSETKHDTLGKPSEHEATNADNGVEQDTETRTRPPTTINDPSRAVDSDVRFGTNACTYHLPY